MYICKLVFNYETITRKLPDMRFERTAGRVIPSTFVGLVYFGYVSCNCLESGKLREAPMTSLQQLLSRSW